MMFLKSEEIDEYHTCFQQPRDTNEAVLSAKPSMIQGTKISQDENFKTWNGFRHVSLQQKKNCINYERSTEMVGKGS